MVDKPTPSNPSAKWTNFTDGSCQRLIYDGDLENNARYLLGCDALDCCVERQEGNHIEYQIPNVHPSFLTKVESLGKHTISQNEGSKIVKVTCDVSSWKFGLATYYAFTTKDPKTNVTVLNRWTVDAEGKTSQTTILATPLPPMLPSSTLSSAFQPSATTPCHVAMLTSLEKFQSVVLTLFVETAIN